MNDTDPVQSDPAPGPIPPTRPDAAEVSELARHTDPSQVVAGKAQTSTETALAAETAKRSVAWVRPSELMGMAGAHVAGRGIDFHAELTRRAREPMVRAVAASRRAVSERARRLPPVTAFGQRGTSPAGATRPGVGLR